LVAEYSGIIKEIKEKEWTLAELKRDLDSITKGNS
jgi:hypothetical protein